MKKLELNQMENLEGGKYCTKEATGILLATGTLFFVAATGGLGAFALAGFSFYLSIDSAASGSCTSW
jgi:hypothetical protein